MALGVKQQVAFVKRMGAVSALSSPEFLRQRAVIMSISVHKSLIVI